MEPKGWLILPEGKISSARVFSSGNSSTITLATFERQMKTHKNLMAKILAPENLIAAWKTARKGKTRTRAVLAFDVRAGATLAELSARIKLGTYRPREYRRFQVY